MKKNKIFINQIKKRIGNNQNYFNISEEELVDNDNIMMEENNLSVREKINKVFERNGYVFNVDVKIITDKKEYNTKIAGKVNDHLITLDNDIININDIKNIIIKN